MAHKIKESVDDLSLTAKVKKQQEDLYFPDLGEERLERLKQGVDRPSPKPSLFEKLQDRLRGRSDTIDAATAANIKLAEGSPLGDEDLAAQQAMAEQANAAVMGSTAPVKTAAAKGLNFFDKIRAANPIPQRTIGVTLAALKAAAPETLEQVVSTTKSIPKSKYEQLEKFVFDAQNKNPNDPALPMLRQKLEEAYKRAI